MHGEIGIRIEHADAWGGGSKGGQFGQQSLTDPVPAQLAPPRKRDATLRRVNVATGHRIRHLLVTAIACVALAIVAGAPANARAGKYCHGLLVGHVGDVYSVSRVSCATARNVGLRFMHHHRLLAHWKCRGRRTNSGRSEFVFTCHGPHGRSLRVFDSTFAD